MPAGGGSDAVAHPELKTVRRRATAASGAGFTPAERAGGLGGAPLAPPSSKRSGAGFTPAERAGGLGGAPLAPPSSKRSGAGFTPAGRAGEAGDAKSSEARRVSRPRVRR